MTLPVNKKILFTILCVLATILLLSSTSVRSMLQRGACSILVCRVSTDVLAEFVKSKLQANIDKTPEFETFGLKVESVLMLHDQGNHYKGIVRLATQGKLYEIVINAVADRDNAMFEIPPGSFGFLVNSATIDLFRPPAGLFLNT